MIPTIKNTGKCKVMCGDRKQISVCLKTGKWSGDTVRNGRIKEGRAENFEVMVMLVILTVVTLHGFMSISKTYQTD